jgi:hypothetical protein
VKVERLTADIWRVSVSRSLVTSSEALAMAIDDDIVNIWREFDYELEANRKMAANHQLAFEQTIGNIAALKMLNDSSIEESVKN